MATSASLAAGADATLFGPDELELHHEMLKLEKDIQAAVDQIAGTAASPAGAAVTDKQLQGLLQFMRGKIRDLELLSEEQDTDAHMDAVEACLELHQAEYQRLAAAIATAKGHAKKQQHQAAEQMRRELFAGASLPALQREYKTVAEAVQGTHEVTESLQRAKAVLTQQIEQTSATMAVLDSSNNTLGQAKDEFVGQKKMHKKGAKLLNTIQKQEQNDRRILWLGLLIFLTACTYIGYKRAPGLVKAPVDLALVAATNAATQLWHQAEPLVRDHLKRLLPDRSSSSSGSAAFSPGTSRPPPDDPDVVRSHRHEPGEVKPSPVPPPLPGGLTRQPPVTPPEPQPGEAKAKYAQMNEEEELQNEQEPQEAWHRGKQGRQRPGFGQRPQRTPHGSARDWATGGPRTRQQQQQQQQQQGGGGFRLDREHRQQPPRHHERPMTPPKPEQNHQVDATESTKAPDMPPADVDDSSRLAGMGLPYTNLEDMYGLGAAAVAGSPSVSDINEGESGSLAPVVDSHPREDFVFSSPSVQHDNTSSSRSSSRSSGEDLNTSILEDDGAGEAGQDRDSTSASAAPPVAEPDQASQNVLAQQQLAEESTAEEEQQTLDPGRLDEPLLVSLEELEGQQQEMDLYHLGDEFTAWTSVDDIGSEGGIVSDGGKVVKSNGEDLFGSGQSQTGATEEKGKEEQGEREEGDLSLNVLAQQQLAEESTTEEEQQTLDPGRLDEPLLMSLEELEGQQQEMDLYHLGDEFTAWTSVDDIDSEGGIVSDGGKDDDREDGIVADPKLASLREYARKNGVHRLPGWLRFLLSKDPEFSAQVAELLDMPPPLHFGREEVALISLWHPDAAMQYAAMEEEPEEEVEKEPLQQQQQQRWPERLEMEDESPAVNMEGDLYDVISQQQPGRDVTMEAEAPEAEAEIDHAQVDGSDQHQVAAASELQQQEQEQQEDQQEQSAAEDYIGNEDGRVHRSHQRSLKPSLDSEADTLPVTAAQQKLQQLKLAASTESEDEEFQHEQQQGEETLAAVVVPDAVGLAPTKEAIPADDDSVADGGEDVTVVSANGGEDGGLELQLEKLREYARRNGVRRMPPWVRSMLADDPEFSAEVAQAEFERALTRSKRTDEDGHERNQQQGEEEETQHLEVAEEQQPEEVAEVKQPEVEVKEVKQPEAVERQQSKVEEVKQPEVEAEVKVEEVKKLNEGHGDQAGPEGAVNSLLQTQAETIEAAAWTPTILSTAAEAQQPRVVEGVSSVQEPVVTVLQDIEPVAESLGLGLGVKDLVKGSVDVGDGTVDEAIQPAVAAEDKETIAASKPMDTKNFKMLDVAAQAEVSSSSDDKNVVDEVADAVGSVTSPALATEVVELAAAGVEAAEPVMAAVVTLADVTKPVAIEVETSGEMKPGPPAEAVVNIVAGLMEPTDKIAQPPHKPSGVHMTPPTPDGELDLESPFQAAVEGSQPTLPQQSAGDPKVSAAASAAASPEQLSKEAPHQEALHQESPVVVLELQVPLVAASEAPEPSQNSEQLPMVTAAQPTEATQHPIFDGPVPAGAGEAAPQQAANTQQQQHLEQVYETPIETPIETPARAQDKQVLQSHGTQQQVPTITTMTTVSVHDQVSLSSSSSDAATDAELMEQHSHSSAQESGDVSDTTTAATSTVNYYTVVGTDAAGAGKMHYQTLQEQEQHHQADAGMTATLMVTTAQDLGAAVVATAGLDAAADYPYWQRDQQTSEQGHQQQAGGEPQQHEAVAYGQQAQEQTAQHEQQHYHYYHAQAVDSNVVAAASGWTEVESEAPAAPAV